MIKNYQYLRILSLITIFSLLIVGCSHENEIDPEEVESILPYDSSKHIYGVFGVNNGDKWEVVIDPVTGKLDRIPETKEIFGGVSGYIGSKDLTSFDRNERIYIPTADDTKLILQNLDNFEITTIDLTDMSLNKTVVFPKLIRFGKDQNEIYLLDTDDSLWKIDLDSQVVTRVHDRIPVSDNKAIFNFFYIESTGNFLCNIKGDGENDKLIIFNPQAPNSSAFITTNYIASGFGFVQHPIDRDKFYYIQRLSNNKGYRLMYVEVVEDQIFVSQKSVADLPIENLSTYLQTIHSATNTYILRAGSNNIDSPSNNLYSINLNTGVLVNEVDLKEVGFISKLAGE